MNEQMVDIFKVTQGEKMFRIQVSEKLIKKENIAETVIFYRAMKSDNALVSLEVKGNNLVITDPGTSAEAREYGMAKIDAQDIIGIIPDIRRLYKIERSATGDRMVELWTFYPDENYVEIQKLDDGMVTVTNIHAGQPGLFEHRENVLAVVPFIGEVPAREVTCH